MSWWRFCSDQALMPLQPNPNVGTMADVILMSNQKADAELLDLHWADALSDEEWSAFLAGALNIPGRTPPSLPPAEFQRSWVGGAGLIALTEAMTFLRRMKAGMAEAGAP